MNIKKINYLALLNAELVKTDPWSEGITNHHALLSCSYPTLKYNYLLLQSEPTHREELPHMSEDGRVLVTYGEAMLMLEGLLCLLDWILQESGQNSVSEGKKKNNTHTHNKL